VKQLCTDFELGIGERIRTIHTDQGSEFIDRKIQLILVLEHIGQRPWPHTQHNTVQNGTLEQEVQSTSQMAGTMMLASGLGNTVKVTRR